MLVLVDVPPDRVEEVEKDLGLQAWASRRVTPARLQLGPLEGERTLAGRLLRLHPPAMGQDLRWLLVTQGVLTPEDAARAAQCAVGAQMAGQAAQAMDPELGDFVDM
eukprot:12272667-Alexandrium_andersonii.AAC.1